LPSIVSANAVDGSQATPRADSVMSRLERKCPRCLPGGPLPRRAQRRLRLQSFPSPNLRLFGNDQSPRRDDSAAPVGCGCGFTRDLWGTVE
jgi:hypothetical protein